MDGSAYNSNKGKENVSAEICWVQLDNVEIRSKFLDHESIFYVDQAKFHN